MKRYLSVAAVLVGALLLFGCLGGSLLSETAGGGLSPSDGMSPGIAPYAAPSGMADYDGIVPRQYLDQSGRMVVKTGSAEVEVQQGTLEEKYARLKEIVNQSGGFVYGTQYGETQSSKYYRVTVKLPPSAFENFPQALATLGALKSMNTGSEDVTQQYVDVAVRIKNLEAQRERLLEYYDRAENVSELLEVTREVTRVQTEIESLTAQKLQLERSAEMATISVRIYEEAPMVDKTVMVPLNALIGIFIGAISLSITIVVAISGFLIPILIGVGILALLVIGVKRLFSRGKKPK